MSALAHGTCSLARPGTDPLVARARVRMWVTTDNGGMTSGPQPYGFGAWSASSNFPLRGGKGTLFEGGVRGISFVTGGFLPAAARGGVRTSLMQHVDIPTTLAAVAGAPWSGKQDGATPRVQVRPNRRLGPRGAAGEPEAASPPRALEGALWSHAHDCALQLAPHWAAQSSPPPPSPPRGVFCFKGPPCRESTFTHAGQLVGGARDWRRVGPHGGARQRRQMRRADRRPAVPPDAPLECPDSGQVEAHPSQHAHHADYQVGDRRRALRWVVRHCAERFVPLSRAQRHAGPHLR